MVSILCSATDNVCSSNWFTMFKVLTLSITMLTMSLYLNNFCLGLGSVADFLNTEARAPTSIECTPCLPCEERCG